MEQDTTDSLVELDSSTPVQKNRIIHNNGYPVQYDYKGLGRKEFRKYEKQLQRKFRKEQNKLAKA